MRSSNRPHSPLAILAGWLQAITAAVLLMAMGAVPAAAQTATFDLVWSRDGGGEPATGSLTLQVDPPFTSCYGDCPGISAFDIQIDATSYSRADVGFFALELMAPLTPGNAAAVTAEDVLELGFEMNDPGGPLPFGPPKTFFHDGYFFALSSVTLRGAGDAPPAGLQLSLQRDSVTLMRDQAMTPIASLVTGGDGNYSFGVSPDLPAGLSIDPATGTISGAPGLAQPAETYAVTVTDGTGETDSANLTIEVTYPALTLDLSSNAIVTLRGEAIDAVTATVSGGDGNYIFTAVPALPEGLAIDPATGEIGGTPSGEAGSTSHFIIVSDGSGAFAEADLHIDILNAELTLAIHPDHLNATRGQAIAPVSAAAAGGAGGYAFSIDPDLPVGLSIDPSTGTISGTPMAAMDLEVYTVTVADGDGAIATAGMQIEIGHPPLALVLSRSSLVAQSGVEISAITASVTGGDGDYSFDVMPALPSGLEIESDTGTISGTPDAATPLAEHAIIVTDGVGNRTSAGLTILVAESEVNLSLSTTTLAGVLGVEIPPVTADVDGGDGDYSFAVTPDLPSGLSLDAATGTISGTPAAIHPATVHAVTVTDGSGGAAIAELHLSVVDPEVTLALSQSSLAAVRGQPITPITASASGGAGGYSFAIAPDLPTGLSIGSTTGAISGTPTVVLAETEFTVTVTDAGGASESANLTIAVEHPELDLSLSATHVTATRGLHMAAVNANATGGDGNFDFSIDPELPDGLSIDAATGIIGGVPTALRDTQDYTVTVTDGTSMSASATLSLAVVSPELTLSMSSASLAAVRGEPLPLVAANALGGDGNYDFTVIPDLPAGIVLDSASGIIFGIPEEFHPAQSHTFTVTDGEGSSATASMTISVSNQDIAIGMSEDWIEGLRGEAIEPVTAEVTGGGDTLTFWVEPDLPEGLSIGVTTGRISGVPGEALPATEFDVWVSDDHGDSSVTRITLSIANPELGISLSAISLAATRGEAIDPIQATAWGGDGTYSFSVEPALPAGLSIDPTSGVISGSAEEVHAPTEHDVIVMDGAGASRSVSLTISVDHSGLALSLSGTSLEATAGVAIDAVTASVSGGDGTYAFTIAPDLPEGLAIDPATGTIQGTPSAFHERQSYTVTVTDGGSASASVLIEIAIGHPELSLALSHASLTGTRFTPIEPVTPLPVGGDGTYSFAISPDLPGALSIDPATGVITGTPAETLPATVFTISVSDGAGSTAQAALTISLDDPEIVLELSHAALVATLGEEITPVTFEVSGGDGDYAILVAPELPEGLVLDAANRQIAGAPVAAQATATHTIIARDGNGLQASASFDITVNHPGLNVALNLDEIRATRGEEIAPVVIMASGGDGNFSYSVSPALPIGIHLNGQTGVISGAPVATQAPLDYLLTVTDGTGAFDTVTLSIGIIHPDVALTLSRAEISGQVGVAIAPVAASASGGTGEYTYSVAPALPAGLVLDTTTGAITGAPASAQSAIGYTVTVTDSDGGSASAALSISVASHAAMEMALSQGELTAVRGEPITPITASVSGGDGNYSFSIAPALPVGLSLDTATGRISGTPVAVHASRSHTVTASDGSGRSATAQLQVVVLESETRVQEVFTEATTGFMASRAERMLSMEPRGYRFENRRAARGVTEVAARANDDRMMLGFSGNFVSTDTSLHGWFEGEYSFARLDAGEHGARSGSFGMASAGVDWLVTPQLAFGVMVSADTASEDGEASRVSGTGWMAGPYLAGQIGESVYFTLRGAVGDTKNEASVDVYRDGSDRFLGEFRTRRAMMRAALYGVHRFESGIEVSPELDIAWIRDRQGDYTVTDGISTVQVPGGSVEIGRITVSTLVEVPNGDESLIGFARPAVAWNFRRQGANLIEQASGSLEIGVRTGPTRDWQGVLALRFDGIGASGRSASSVRLGVNRRF